MKKYFWRALRNAAKQGNQLDPSVLDYYFQFGITTRYRGDDFKQNSQIWKNQLAQNGAKGVANSNNKQNGKGNSTKSTSTLTTRESRKSEPDIPDGYKERGFNESVRTKTDYDDIVQQEFIDNPEIYKQLANKVTKEKAKAIMDKGLAFAETEFPKLLERMDSTAIALGENTAI